MSSLNNNDEQLPALSEVEKQERAEFESIQIDMYTILMRLRRDLKALFDGQDTFPKNDPAAKMLLPVSLDVLDPGPNNEHTEPYYEIVPGIAIVVEQTRELTHGVEIEHEHLVRETSYLSPALALRIIKLLQPDNFRNYVEYYLRFAKEFRKAAVLAERNNRDYATVAADQQMIEEAAEIGYKTLTGKDLDTEWPAYG